jgi:hypothetical protein
VERLIAWYRVSSSGLAVVGLVLANLVPLVGVLWFGWNLWTILAIYWAENGIVGLYNVLKMAAVQGLGKVATIPFFVMHYGMFWLVHGIFVFSLPTFVGSDMGGAALVLPGEPPESRPATAGGADLSNVAFAAVFLLISHGVSYYFNFIRRGEYRRVTVTELMGQPYGRVIVLHMTILLGALGVAFVGAPVVALLILIALKTGIDLAFHLAQHRATAGQVLDGSSRTV